MDAAGRGPARDLVASGAGAGEVGVGRLTAGGLTRLQEASSGMCHSRHNIAAGAGTDSKWRLSGLKGTTTCGRKPILGTDTVCGADSLSTLSN